MRLPYSFLAAALLCGAVAASSASAADPQDASFALKPVLYDPALPATKSYFILPVKPGATVEDKLRIVNTGGKTGTAFIYPVDATTGGTSGAVYLSRQAPRRDVAAWITVATPKLTLAPGKERVVPFTVHVPRSVRPGDHLGAIVAENAQVQSSRGKGALQLRIRHLTIAAVELQLPGTATGRVEATGVEAGGEHGYQYVYIHLKSTGTVLVKPAATLTVRNAAGRIVAKRSVQLDTFVPGTGIDYPALLPKKTLEPGKYTAEVRLRSSTAPVVGYRETAVAPFDVTKTFPFTVTSNQQTKVFSGVAPVEPPTRDDARPPSSKQDDVLLGAIAALALVLAGIGYFLFLLPRRRGRSSTPGGPAKPTPPGEPAAAAAAIAEEEDEDEVPGWAGLLAAYDPHPRRQTTGSAAAPAPPETEPLPVAAAAVAPPAPESRAEPRSEPQPAAPAPAKVPARSDVRAAAETNNVSAALVEASLIALGTLLAARLLKRTD